MACMCYVYALPMGTELRLIFSSLMDKATTVLAVRPNLLPIKHMEQAWNAV